MRRLLENIDALYTCDRQDRVLRKAWLIAEDGRIAALGEGDAPEGAYDERVDLAGSVVMPGFVNTHHHFFQTLTRAVPAAQRSQLIDWLRLFYPVWGRMTPDDLGAAAAATSAELLLTGATTSADHFYLIPHCDPAFVEAEIAATRAAGIRLHLVRGSMITMERDLERELEPVLGPNGGGLVDDPVAVLRDMSRTIAAHHDSSVGAMTTVALGPTTPTYDNLEFMRDVAMLADEAGVGLHVHLHPQPLERAMTLKRFGMTPLQVLDSAGFVGERTWFAHGTRLDDADMALMARRGAGLSHCPRTILRLGMRVTPVHAMRAHGVRVAVGVDGAASNDSSSMLGDMRLALLLHRLAGGEGEVDSTEWLDPYDVLLMATRDAAALIGRQDIGRLEVGLCADLVGFDMRAIGFAGARLDLLSGLLLAGDDTRASLTMVAGEPLVRDGRLIRNDEMALRAAADAATERLVERASALTGMDYRSFGHRAAAVA
jgi:cytosine/adenosine deaminase-related metal-dependent hydrolase